MKLNLGQDSETRFGQYFEFQLSRDYEVLKLILVRDSGDEI